MKLLDSNAITQWLAEKGLSANVLPPSRSPESRFVCIYTCPPECRGKIVLANFLAQLFWKTTCMVWITEWTVFNEDEMRTYLAFQRDASAVSCADLRDYPGHLYDALAPETQVEIFSTLLFMMAFTWQGYLIDGEGASIVWLADEIIEIAAKHESTISSIRDISASVCMEDITKSYSR